MKYVKALGLVAVATATLMACIGASKASATVLCKVEGGGPPTGTTCPIVEGAYTKGTELHAVNSGSVTLHTSPKTIECKESTILGKTENEGSATETVHVEISQFTLSSCNCELKVLKSGGYEIHWISNSHNGTVTFNGQEITSTCSTVFGNVHCIFVANNRDYGEITGGNPAIWHMDVTVERGPTNALCNEESTFTATYEFTSPKPLYVASHT